MTQQIMYRYLGTNGVIDSPVHLEGIYSVKSWLLRAAPGFNLTQDGVNMVKSVRVTDEAELSKWREVKDNSK